MQWRRDTNLGEERLITTSPENTLATRIAGNSSAIAEKLAHILGLPYGRIDQVPHDLGGVYELVYEFIRKGGKLPVYARWIEGEGART